MSHTYVSELIHCVFSTKERRKIINPEIQPKLWAYLGGIARKNGFVVLIAGGTDDHAHLLLSLPASMPVAKAVQLLKGGSSKWLNETLGNHFAWQEGYGAFTLGISQKLDTYEYIKSQPQHHQKRSFEDEFLTFLKKHGIEYDPKYVWGWNLPRGLRPAVITKPRPASLGQQNLSRPYGTSLASSTTTRH
jgi:REP element-mobilizing transposase RayT